MNWLLVTGPGTQIWVWPLSLAHSREGNDLIFTLQSKFSVLSVYGRLQGDKFKCTHLKPFGHTPALDAFLLNELYRQRPLAVSDTPPSPPPLFLNHKQIASIMERKPDWIWTLCMPLLVSCLCILMDIILSDYYLALIYNYYILWDYVAVYQLTGCIPGLYRCMPTCKYKWIYLQVLHFSLW